MPHDSKQGQLHNHTDRNLRQQLTKKTTTKQQPNIDKQQAPSALKSADVISSDIHTYTCTHIVFPSVIIQFPSVQHSDPQLTSRRAVI